ncbi:kinase-like protein [Saccharata proteae CBS 121410]|uniref:EKC/KEOPS complex subunit BUD32 n=1 Tax=Saccharata proteae CBS 121410 TaxID=1314787 RepID=A0A9P4HUZ9_9PEZI|nr:kinase-like protein [Saccharata proteae CBS 121410]
MAAIPAHAPHHPLPAPFSTSDQPLIPLTQGAEALVYRTTFLTPTTPCALKYRPPKPYRHPILDARLTRQRILSEARVLARCRREGVRVPGVLGADWEKGWLVMEWVGGWTVRRMLDWCKSVGQRVSHEELRDLMRRIGIAVQKMHSIGVVHGDLTTSNLMLKPSTPLPPEAEKVPDPESLKGEITIIDFGLAAQTVQDEDKAVDLYVLERAFGSTHPEAEGLFGIVLEAYGSVGGKAGRVVLRRLEDVRARGRKKSMLG